MAIRFVAARPGLCWAGAFAIYMGTVVALQPVPFIVAADTSPQFLATHLAHGALATLVLIPVVFGDPNARVPRRVLGNPLLAWMGLISYGFYLWNVTIAYDLGAGGGDAGFVTVLIMTLLIAVPIAAASYYLVERPLMRLKYRPLREVLRRRSRAAEPAPGTRPG